uniref:Leucine-rich repeat-containing N-terminal plant-type domain-containing protein n=1 Tax=Oryza nivara TaxID=4536 RepID=A0A0E0G3T2_ORYNI
MNLIGNIPNWIWKLQKLEMLFLSGNNFIGEIGSDISALKLQELDLSINKLTGSIPEDIVNLKNLKILYLYYNNLVGQIPSGVGMLPNLTDLRLFKLGKYSELEHFQVSNNNLSGRSNGDMLGEKINIPPGPLCAKRPDLCKNCWCCEVSDGQCYQSLEACQVNCPLPSPPAI